jgi:RHS repeat-associated protein
LGSLRQVVDATGGVESVSGYRPFGVAMEGGGSGYGFTGEWADPYIKLVFLRARWYQPKDGRFLSQDTVMPDFQNPQSIHLYTYVKNNPTNWVDPSGHMETGAEAGDFRPSYESYGENRDWYCHTHPQERWCEPTFLIPAAIRNAKRWGFRFDITVGFIINFDTNFELTCAGFPWEDPRLTQSINLEVGPIGAGGSFGPVFSTEENENPKPLSLAPRELGLSIAIGPGFEIAQAVDPITGEQVAFYAGVEGGFQANIAGTTFRGAEGIGYVDVIGITIDYMEVAKASAPELFESAAEVTREIVLEWIILGRK